jgi:hypothetical protein
MATALLSCVCDQCITDCQAKNLPVYLWSCDQCGGLACREMLLPSDDGGRLCMRCVARVMGSSKEST